MRSWRPITRYLFCDRNLSSLISQVPVTAPGFARQFWELSERPFSAVHFSRHWQKRCHHQRLRGNGSCPQNRGIWQMGVLGLGPPTRTAYMFYLSSPRQNKQMHVPVPVSPLRAVCVLGMGWDAPFGRVGLALNSQLRGPAICFPSLQQGLELCCSARGHAVTTRNGSVLKYFTGSSLPKRRYIWVEFDGLE